ERLLHDNLPGTVRHALEVAALVTCGLKAEPLELARDVPGGPGKAFGAGTTSLHGIVGEDVEARHEIALTDLRGGGARVQLKRIRRRVGRARTAGSEQQRKQRKDEAG